MTTIDSREDHANRNLPISIDDLESSKKDLKKRFLLSKKESDLEFARAMYLDLIQESRDGIELTKEIVQDSMHPRAAEVLSGMIKTASETVDRLVELHKADQSLSEKPSSTESVSNTTNNNLMITTDQLQKMLKDMND